MVELGQLDFDVIAVAQEELGPVQIARNGHGSDGDAWPEIFSLPDWTTFSTGEDSM